jgi:hypothetical protein
LAKIPRGKFLVPRAVFENDLTVPGFHIELKIP